MKKIVPIILLLIILLTWCQSKDKKEMVISSDTIPQEQTTSTNENLISNNKEVTNEDELVEYIEGVDQDIDSIISSENVNQTTKEKLKNTYKTLTDFIFYDGTIKGKTFKELSTETKEKILNLYLNIDGKIEQIEPNYKETIASTTKKVYTASKDKAIELKEKIKSEYKEQVGINSYNQTVQQYEEGKNNLKETYEIYKPAVDTVKDKTKQTYENAKDKISSWWNDRK